MRIPLWAWPYIAGTIGGTALLLVLLIVIGRAQG